MGHVYGFSVHIPAWSVNSHQTICNLHYLWTWAVFMGALSTYPPGLWIHTRHFVICATCEHGPCSWVLCPYYCKQRQCGLCTHEHGPWTRVCVQTSKPRCLGPVDCVEECSIVHCSTQVMWMLFCPFNLLFSLLLCSEDQCLPSFSSLVFLLWPLQRKFVEFYALIICGFLCIDYISKTGLNFSLL